MGLGRVLQFEGKIHIANANITVARVWAIYSMELAMYDFF